MADVFDSGVFDVGVFDAPAGSGAIDLNFAAMAASDTLDAGLTLVRGSDGLRINASGLYETETGDAPRFMFDPDTLAARGILIERASTNSLLHAIDFSNAAWIVSGLTVTANNGSAPDGTNAGDKIAKASSGDAYIGQAFTCSNGQDWTVSVVVKPDTIATGRLWLQFFGGSGGIVAGNFDMTGSGSATGGQFGGPTLRYVRIEKAPAGYWRLIVSGTNDATGNTVGSLIYRPGLADADTGDQWIWHGQAEQLARHTSPIITTTAAATRNAEKLRRTGGAITLPAWLMAEWETTAPSMGLRYAVIANDGDLSDFVAIQSLDTPALDALATHTYSASVDQGVIGDGLWSPAAGVHRAAVKLADDDYVFLSNRGARTADTSIDRPLSLAEVWIGGRWDTGTGQNDDVIRRIRTLDVATTEAQINELLGFILAGDVAAVASASGSLTTAIVLSGDATGTATAAADLTTAIALTGSGTAEATASASLTTAIQLSGDAAGQASSSADLTTAIVLSGDATAQATASADLTTSPSGLAGDAAAVATASADLTTAIVLAGDATAVASADASLTTAIQLAGDATAVATATGDLSGAASLAGDAQAEATASADLTTSIVLAGDAVAVASASADLTTSPAGLSGDAAAVATASADLTTQIRLVAVTAQAVATATGELTVGALVAAAARRARSRAGTTTRSRGGLRANAR